MSSFGYASALHSSHPSSRPSPSTIHESDPCGASQVMLGPSPAMAVLWARVRRVAPYFRTALLTGEPGSGQPAVARALHQHSPFSGRPFLALNAADAELRLAHNAPSSSFHEGMLFLPEPEKLSHAAQAGLLRLLRERGSLAPRLVTFAERGLRSLISACNFSSDLANSLGALQIEVPPLRERFDDLPRLAGFLLLQQADLLNLRTPEIASDFLDAARGYTWPGNLDQLQTAMRSILEQSTGDTLHASDLEAALASIANTNTPQAPEPRLVRLDQIIREQVYAVLMACNGNKLRTAEILGISRSTLYRMLDASASSGSSAFPS
jgi:DNA-binding NtrC family response regulator